MSLLKRVATKPSLKSTPPLNSFDMDLANFIASFSLREGYSPSQNEMARFFGKHLNSIQFSLKKLIQNGKIEQTLKNGRGLLALQSNSVSNYIPLLGTVAAGRPIEAIETREQIEVPTWMLKASAQYFVLRVQGESMIEDHIQNGDLVLIRQSSMAQNGERVVALINNEATLKRFEKKKGVIWLHPANAALEPLEIGSHHDFRIAGIFSGVLRKTDG